MGRFEYPLQPDTRFARINARRCILDHLDDQISQAHNDATKSWQVPDVASPQGPEQLDSLADLESMRRRLSNLYASESMCLLADLLGQQTPGRPAASPQRFEWLTPVPLTTRHPQVDARLEAARQAVVDSMAAQRKLGVAAPPAVSAQELDQLEELAWRYPQELRAYAEAAYEALVILFPAIAVTALPTTGSQGSGPGADIL